MAALLPDVIRALLLDRGGGAPTRDLLRWGLTTGKLERLVRDGQLVRVSRGRYALPSDSGDTWDRRRRDHLTAAAALTPADGVAGLRTACLLWGLPVAGIPRRPEAVCPPHAHRPDGVRVVCTDLEPNEVTVLHGIPVTSLERTAADVAIDLPVPRALVSVDAALRQGAARNEVWRILRRRGPVRGIRRARQTVSWADPYSESALESRGRGELLLRGVPRPECNLTFRYQGEEFRPDSVWREEGLTGEADGRDKYEEGRWVEDSLWAERLRQQWFEDELGMNVFRWTDRELRQAPDAAVRRWHRLAARRSASPWTPPPGLEILRTPLPIRELPPGFREIGANFRG